MRNESVDLLNIHKFEKRKSYEIEISINSKLVLREVTHLRIIKTLYHIFKY